MKKYFLLSITIACIILAGCKKKEDTIKPGSIYGTVVDKSSQASVSGAGVELMPKGLKTVTGSDGSFQFTQIDPGDYNLFVTKTGYQDLKSNTITVNPGETAKGDVQIEKLPASLQIKDNNGNIITELDFGGEEGIVSKTFIIVNRGTMTLNFTINKYVAWIESITPLNGTIPVNRDCPIILQIDREKLSDGLNTTSIIITSEDGGVELPVKARKGGYSGDVFVLESAHLMVQLEDLGCVNWSSAKTLCESSTVAGYNDWRLPTKEELSTLYTNRDLIGGFTTERYWSSSWTDYYPYYVDFADGTIGYNNSSYQYYVRAVRTITNENGIYELASANVMVQTQDLGCVNWSSAKTMCESSIVGGYNDWRLPTQSELMTLYHNREIIGGFTNAIYWSSDTSGNNPIAIDFHDGSLGWVYSNNTYNVRAVRTINSGTSATIPTVTTSAPSNVTTNSATCGGNVTSDGGATVTARGVCWSTSQNPTISNSHTTDGTGTGSFTSNITSLAESTTYYVRAYATNSKGTAYGVQQSFTTNSGGSSTTTPTVTTSTPSNVTTNSATCGGNVTSDGGAAVTARGVCWSTSQNPTMSGSHTTDGTGTGLFTSNITGLAENTTYYVRAYAINSEGTAYGTQHSFTTNSGGSSATVPTVTTGTPFDIAIYSAACGGNVTSDGGATVFERGVCYSTSQNPTTSDMVAQSGSGTGSYTCYMTGLNQGTTYYLRAYAINSEGTAYGAQVSFTTNMEPTNGVLQYDDGNGIDALGFTNGGTIYWANMYPTSMLSQYAGTSIVEIEALLNLAGTYTLQIYSGGTSSPNSLVATINVTHNYSDFGWYYIALPNAVPLNTSQNLWIVLSKTHSAGEYPAGVCADSGNPNGRWISDGSGTWEDLGQSRPNTWGIHTYVSNQTKAGKHDKMKIISAQIEGSGIPAP
ncbi:MAG: DUF1566 domain-containing protein [Bacteroidales bacterium]|nr:DUF1566 domain-containing protein [Bacteroidales bacterium]